ncbi:hypothetical protein [Granulicella tundricola]|uniref:hypothetical protein n=1 Tax=Granulicella tundricola TaxID=940615 RepID=UPI0002FC9560|nr:hypothetical protein [Granulicella tundricola]
MLTTFFIGGERLTKNYILNGHVVIKSTPVKHNRCIDLKQASSNVIYAFLTEVMHALSRA